MKRTEPAQEARVTNLTSSKAATSSRSKRVANTIGSLGYLSMSDISCLAPESDVSIASFLYSSASENIPSSPKRLGQARRQGPSLSSAFISSSSAESPLFNAVIPNARGPSEEDGQFSIMQTNNQHSHREQGTQLYKSVESLRSFSSPPIPSASTGLRKTILHRLKSSTCSSASPPVTKTVLSNVDWVNSNAIKWPKLSSPSPKRYGIRSSLSFVYISYLYPFL
ncbi:unnamed protein product [Protopolystoma xenopodis]|uniref:Uncharacterized protein n=1 Tax=Protopolystoma xenopodis TaxID=117903 RepID=A0A448X399_9PLAT|nr:unnamed protein product [Protopolystoma xenopodis]